METPACLKSCLVEPCFEDDDNAPEPHPLQGKIRTHDDVVRFLREMRWDIEVQVRHIISSLKALGAPEEAVAWLRKYQDLRVSLWQIVLPQNCCRR